MLKHVDCLRNDTIFYHKMFPVQFLANINKFVCNLQANRFYKIAGNAESKATPFICYKYCT